MCIGTAEVLLQVVRASAAEGLCRWGRAVCQAGVYPVALSCQVPQMCLIRLREEGPLAGVMGVWLLLLLLLALLR
jgi:hypothetical protein